LQAAGAFLVIFLFAPIFFDQSGIFSSTAPMARGVPISALLVPLVLIALLIGNPRNQFLLLCFAIISIVLPVILRFALEDQSEIDFVLVGSYMVPILVGYNSFILSILFFGRRAASKLLFYSAIAVSIICIPWLLYQYDNIVSNGRANGDVFGWFVIYQVWVYWPTVLAILLCGISEFRGMLAIFLRVILGISIISTGAREPILFCVFFYGIYSIRSNGVRGLLFFLVSAVIAIFISYFVYFSYPDLVISRKLDHMISGAQGLDAGRLFVLEKFDLLGINPVWGLGYSSSGIFGSPHNQYIDLFYRGGLLGCVPIIFIFLMLLLNIKSFNAVIWSVLITIFFVSFNINTPIRVPYSGSIIWFLIFSIFNTSRKGVRNEENSAKFG